MSEMVNAPSSTTAAGSSESLRKGGERNEAVALTALSFIDLDYVDVS